MRIQGPSTTSFLPLLLGAALLAGCDGGKDDQGTDGADTSGSASSSASSGEAGDESGTDSAGGEGGCVEKASPTLADDIQPLLTATCVDECHVDEADAAWALFLLSEGDAYEYLLGPSTQIDTDFEQLNVIEPCAPEKSYLWHKLNGTHLDVGGTGVQMPAKADPVKGTGYWVLDMPLAADKLQLIEDWINAGAPEG